MSPKSSRSPGAKDPDALVAQLGALLIERGWRIAVAESCTGGWLAKHLTDQPGSSAWFGFGFVTYADEAKQRCLGVSEAALRHHGAVSAEVAEQMASGTRLWSGAELAVAITGIAGPDGGTAEKPAGTVWFGFAGPGTALDSIRARFDGDRAAVRRQAVAYALERLLERVGPAGMAG